MAFDGNGNWVSNYSAVAQRDADLPILASNFDNILLADLATSFENCLTKDMQVKPQQAFDANSYKVINVGNPTNTNDAVNLGTLTTSTLTISGDRTFSGSTTFTGTTDFSGDMTLSGNVSLGATATATTPASATDNTTSVATTAWVHNWETTGMKPDTSRQVSVSQKSSGSTYTAGVTGILLVTVNTDLARSDYLDVANQTTGERFIAHVGEYADGYDHMAITIRIWKNDTYKITRSKSVTIKEIPYGGF